MEERESLKKEATELGDKDLLDEFKRKKNEVKKKMKEDQQKYNEKVFEETRSSSNIWKSAYKVLGMTSSKSPTQLNEAGDIIRSPKAMAGKFNETFLDKVKKIRQKANLKPIKINPIHRDLNLGSLRECLLCQVSSSRQCPR